MNNRLVNSNYILRVIFTYMVVLSHSSYLDNTNTSYYIGVDYFFIFSGLMIAYGIDSNGNAKTTFNFTVERIKKLYPHLLFSFFIYFFYQFRDSSIKQLAIRLIGYFYQIIPMMYYVIPVKYTNNYLNFPVWYISVMLIGGMIIHYFYSNHRFLFENLLAPMIVFLGWYFLAQNCDSFNTGAPVGLFTNGSYIRGITEMTCGVILYRVILEIKKKTFTKLFFVFARIGEVLFLAFLFKGISRYGNSKNDLLFVIIICVIIVISFIYPDDKAVFFSKFRFANELMYPVYLNHLFCLSIVKETQVFQSLIAWNRIIASVLIFGVICIYSFFTLNLLWVIKVVLSKVRTWFIVEK